MSDRLVTIAVYATSLEANLARNLLQDEGINAFVADDGTVDTAWFLAGTVGGVKVLVRELEAEKAGAILEEARAQSASDDVQSSSGGLLGGEMAAPDNTAQTETPALAEDDLPEPEPNLREKRAQRAVKAALLGLLFCPLEFYAFYLLIRVFLSDEPLRPQYRRYYLFAAIFNLPLVFWILLAIKAAFF